MKLSERQAAFAKARASGMALIDAYREAGYSANWEKRQNATNMAQRLAQNPKVAAEIERLTPKVTRPPTAPTSDTLTVDEYRRILADIARNPTAKPAERIKCVETDAKLTGIFGQAETKKQDDGKPKPGSEEWSRLLNMATQALDKAENL